MIDQPARGELKNKIALITGAGSGIGRETARVFVREGAVVALADRNLGAAEETLALIEADGGRGIALLMDVTDAATVAAGVARCVEDFGRLDVAFNNAGLGTVEAGCAGQPLDEIEMESWSRLIATNLTGVWLCMKYELQVMRAQRSGVIVNMGSIAGMVGFAGTGAYVASKHGVLGLTRTAALDYGAYGVRVNAVCPGRIATPLIKTQMATGSADLAQKTALGRLGEAQEVAELVSWLASDRSSYATGSAVVLDGGQTAG